MRARARGHSRGWRGSEGEMMALFHNDLPRSKKEQGRRCHKQSGIHAPFPPARRPCTRLRRAFPAHDTRARARARAPDGFRLAQRPKKRSRFANVSVAGEEMQGGFSLRNKLRFVNVTTVHLRRPPAENVFFSPRRQHRCYTPRRTSDTRVGNY